jgi:hypothetical protein
VEIHESSGLFYVSRREAVSIGPIVLEFRVDEVVDLEHGK